MNSDEILTRISDLFRPGVAYGANLGDRTAEVLNLLAENTTDSATSTRVRTLQALGESMRRGYLAELSAGLPTIAAPTGNAATTIAVGTLWAPCDAGVPETEYFDWYSYNGGEWAQYATSFPFRHYLFATSLHLGNGSDITSGPTMTAGSNVRFGFAGDELELKIRAAGTATVGLRLKVRNTATGLWEYAYEGLLGNRADFNEVFIPIDFGSAKWREIELEYSSNAMFGGIRCSTLYRPYPLPQVDGLRIIAPGDSMLASISETVAAAPNTSLRGSTIPLLQQLLGQPDVWNSGVGATGLLNDNSNTRSNLLERVQLDIIDPAPDAVIWTPGVNDSGSTAAAIQAAWETALGQCVDALPGCVHFVVAPLLNASDTTNQWDNFLAGTTAAVAQYPKHVYFRDTIGEDYAYGTGRQGTTTGDGNADLIRGPDSTHDTLLGHEHNALTMRDVVAHGIPVLLAAQ
jgi:hypothetical protein